MVDGTKSITRRQTKEELDNYEEGYERIFGKKKKKKKDTKEFSSAINK